MSEPTAEERAEEVQAIAARISDLIAGEQHAPTLDALMAVYMALAVKFDCCTQAAADVSMRAAMRLARHASEARRSPREDTAAAMPAPTTTQLH